MIAKETEVVKTPLTVLVINSTNPILAIFTYTIALMDFAA
jgi:hypothetical protein